MTPQEFAFFFELVEKTSQNAYRHGYQDSTAKKPLDADQFKLTQAHMLLLKTQLSKHVQKR